MCAPALQLDIVDLQLEYSIMHYITESAVDIMMIRGGLTIYLIQQVVPFCVCSNAVCRRQKLS